MCVFHDDDITSEFCELVYKITLSVFLNVRDLNLRICCKCGGIGHKPYSGGCLFSSERLRNDYLKGKREFREKMRRKELFRKLQHELRKAYKERTYCVACHKAEMAYDCQNDLCGFCCLDDECRFHVDRRKKRLHNERKRNRRNDRRPWITRV